MRKSSGLLLLLAGVGAASYYAVPPSLMSQIGSVGGFSSADAQQLDRKAFGGSSPSVAAPFPGLIGSNGPRIFSPTTPLVAQGSPGESGAVRLAQAPVRNADATGRSPAFVAPLSADNSRRLASSKPADDDARRELTRDLQKELKRVGCFDGEVNGTWSPASKKAMSAFMDRVNATLPVEDPDYILLTLVQGHAAQACGKGCPAGQGLSTDGRCQPRAILAQSARKSDDRKIADRVEKRSTEPRLADAKPAEAPIQTGSIAKLPAAATAASANNTVATVEPTKAMPQKPETAKVLASPPVPMAQIIAPSPAASPLPGRMAMGAPVPSPEDTAKLDDIEARKRRAQAALAEEQKRVQTQAEESSLKAERLAAEAQRRERQVAAADARRSAQRQAEALENSNIASNDGAPENKVGDPAKMVAITAAAAATREANERRAIARRAREARERDQERAERERERRVVVAAPLPAPAVVKRAAPRYVPTVASVRASPAPVPRPQPDKRWARTFFSDLNGRN
jgi:hypothetical protein